MLPNEGSAFAHNELIHWSLGIKRIYCYCDIWWKRWWLVNRSKVGSWFVHCPLEYIFLCFTPGFEISIIPECLRELSNYIGTLFADASLQSHWLITYHHAGPISQAFVLHHRHQQSREIVKYRQYRSTVSSPVFICSLFPNSAMLTLLFFLVNTDLILVGGEGQLTLVLL